MPVTTSERMTDLDTVMWSLDEHPKLSNTIAAIGFLEPAVDAERVRRRVDRASRLVPRLRQKVSAPPGPVPPWWEFDPAFDLDNHFSLLGPAEVSRDDVMATATKIAAEPFPPHRPLWQITVIPHVEGDRSAFIMKAHHSIADGLGALRIQAELFELEPDAPMAAMPDIPAGEPTPLFDLMGATAVDEVGRGTGLLRSAGRLLMDAAGSPAEACDRGVAAAGSLARAGLGSEPLSPLMTDRAYDMVLGGLSFPFQRAREAARRAEVKLNDFFVTAVCMGMSDYHRRHGHAIERLRMGMPLDVRVDDEAEGNQIAAIRLEIPVDCGTATEQMQVLRALMSTARQEEAIDAMGHLYGLVSRLPNPVIAATFAKIVSGTDFLASNMPGVPVPVYLEGSRLVEQFPYGPLSTAAANVTLMSYADRLHVGVATDSAAIPDPDVFIDSLGAGFEAATSGE